MKVTVLLADKGTANPQLGTLNLLNVGWSMTTPILAVPPGAAAPQLMTKAQAVVVFLEGELAECNRQIEIEVELATDDGLVVELAGPAGPQPLRMTQQIVLSPPPGAPNGFPGRGNLMIELPGGLPLQPGVYKWRVRANGNADEAWGASFFIARPPAAPTFGASQPAG